MLLAPLCRPTLVVALYFIPLVAVTWQQEGSRYRDERKCEPVIIPICKDIGYNLTYMPNRFGQRSQMDAGLVIHQFWPLIHINCSSRLRHFVCSVYAPVCDPIYKKEVLPCRSFCEEVRDACEPIMQQRLFSWPENLRCTEFPTRIENAICMRPDVTDESSARRTPEQPGFTTDGPGTKYPDLGAGNTKNNGIVVEERRPVVVLPKRSGATSCGCVCQHPFVYPNRSLTAENLPPCVLPCKQYFFSDEERNFVNFWIGLWSVLTLISTFIVCATFLVDRARFSYAERPAFWIAFCYFMVALGYLIRVGQGFEAVACDRNTNFLRYSATGPAPCTAVFMLTYFFSNVAWIWWVFLCMNWFLGAGLRWSPEAMASYSQYFHFVAWLIPTVQTMAILAMAAVDSDPVSGMCYVGNHDRDTLKIFVIAPLLIYLVLSICFLVAGMTAIVYYHRMIRLKGGFSQKLDRILAKLGVFATAFLVPAVAVIICFFYEHNNRETWEKSANCPCMLDKKRPKFYVYLMKYLMSLILGLSIGLWVTNSSTLASWKSVTWGRCWNGRKASRERDSNYNERRYLHPPTDV